MGPDYALAISDLGIAGSVAELDAEIAPGESVSIVGRAGSGTAQLARCLAGLDTPDTGSIFLGGTNRVEISALNADARARLRRRRLAYLSGDGNLIGELLVRHNLTLPSRLSRNRLDPARFDRIVSSFGLARMLERRARDLSPSDQLSVALARTALMQPDVIIADHLSRGLNIRATSALTRLLDSFTASGTAVVILTDDEPMTYASETFYTLVDARLQSQT